MIAKVLTGRRATWIVLAFSLIALVLLSPVTGKLKSVQNNDSINYLPRGAQSTQVQQILAELPGGNTADAVVVYARTGGLTGPDLARVAAARTAVANGVDLAAPLGPVVRSTDHAAALFRVPLSSAADTLPDKVSRIRDLTASTGALTVAVTGPGAAQVDSSNQFAGVDLTLLLAAAAVVALLLLLIYRSPILWLLPLVAGGLAVVVAMSATYALARWTGLTVTALSSGILYVLVFGVGSDYALLLVSRYREQLRRHDDHRHAMAQALRSAAPPIIASAGTVVLALLCLLFASVNSDRGLGPVLAVGVLVALLVSLTTLPALLLVTGRRVFWPAVPALGSPEQAGRAWHRLGAALSRRPRRAWLVTAALLALAAIGLTTLQLGLPADKSFTTTVESISGQQLIDAHFPSGSSSPTLVLIRPGSAADARSAVGATSGVAAVTTSNESPQWSELSVVLTSAPDSRAATVTIDRLRSRMAAVPGADALVGGPTAIALDTDRGAAHDRTIVFPLVLLVVLLVLGLLLRSLLAPILLTATVVASFAASFGLSALVFRYVLGFAGTDQGVPLYAFIFLVALGVDYNIFLMSRAREEAQRHGLAEGIRRSLALTGTVITSAGGVLAATFGVLALLPIVIMIEVGVSVALGILLDTLVVRSILVPALSLDIGRWMWWPAPLGKSPPEPLPCDLNLPVAAPPAAAAFPATPRS